MHAPPDPPYDDSDDRMRRAIERSRRFEQWAMIAALSLLVAIVAGFLL